MPSTHNVLEHHFRGAAEAMKPRSQPLPYLPQHQDLDPEPMFPSTWVSEPPVCETEELGEVVWGPTVSQQYYNSADT